MITNIDKSVVNKGRAAVWWLGQHSFIVKLNGSALYLDPFLSPHKGRLVPPLLDAGQITNATLIFGSHDHLDHIDRPAWPIIAKASPGARFVVPALLLKRLSRDLKIQPERFIALDDGRRVLFRGLEITAVASAHEFLDRDARTGQYPYLGYVVKGGGLTFYHSGDACVYEGLQSKLARFPLDIAFLPINGRDACRLKAGCVGNMTYQEAADLAGSLKPRLTIPGHFDMFANNRENPSLFLDYLKVKYPGLRARVLPYGERVLVP